MTIGVINLKLQTFIAQHLGNYNRHYSQSRRVYGALRKKFAKRPRPKRPHKPTRNQLRPPIPFLDHIKQCEDSDEALHMFHQYYEMGYSHGYPSYAALVYKLARARKFHAVDAVLRFLRTLDIRCEEALFIALIRHYGKAQLVEEAVGIFREMGRSFNCVRTVQSFNTILNVLVNNGRVCEAIELFENGSKMGFRLNSVSFNIMIKMWLGREEWGKANEVFDEMLKREVEPTVVTYNSQIGFLTKMGDVDEANALFEDMVKRRKKPNAVTYALRMEGLCATGNFKDAKKMMFDMEYQGCKVQLVNYGVLMTDLAKRGLIDEAKGLLVEMKKRRIKPDVVMYNILINSLCKEGSISEGYKLLVQMQVKGCEPNAASYRMVLDGFCRVNDFLGSMKVFNAMLYSKHIPRIETCCSLVIGLVRCGEISDACFVLEEMEKKNMKLNLASWEVLVGEMCFDDKSITELLTDITHTCCSTQAPLSNMI